MHIDHLPGSFFGPSNLVDLLRHRAAHQGNDRGFTYLTDGETDEVHWTYAELDRRARAIGSWLQSQGLAGERALLLYPAGLEFIAAFFGCLYAGAVAVPAYPPRRNRTMSRIQTIADDAEAKVALTTHDVLERIQEVIDETPDLKRIRWRATDQLERGLEHDWQHPDVHGDTLAFLQYTSGSTGVPKGVVLNHANLMHNSALISYAFEVTRTGRSVFWLPSYHDMGLIGGILQPMYVGQLNVLMSPVSFLQKPLRWLQAISRYKVAISGGPNFAYDLCVRKITPDQTEDLDLSTWRLAFNGAEPIREETIESFSKAFAHCGFKREAFYPCYGLAEATLLVSGGFRMAPPVIRTFDAESLENHQVVDALPDEEGARSLVGCGGTLMDQEILIVDPETRTRCPADGVGEIWVAGPSVALGYWKRPEETIETFHAHLADGSGPYLRTGDLGFMCDNELFVNGRLKDLIIIRGLNHYPQDIELDRGAQPSGAAGRGRGGVLGGCRWPGTARDRAGSRARPPARSGGFGRSIRRDSPPHRGRARNVGRGDRPDQSRQHPEDIERQDPAACLPRRILAGDARHRRSMARMVGRKETGQAGIGSRRFRRERQRRRRSGAARTGRRTGAGTGHDHAPKVSDPLVQIVLNEVRKVARERAGNLTLETNILDLGLDSLERMEIVAALEEAFGGRFPEDVLPTMETCREVVDAVQAYLGATPKARARAPPPKNCRWTLTASISSPNTWHSSRT